MDENLIPPKEYRKLSMDERRKIWIEISDLTEDEFNAIRDWQKGRQGGVPQPGSVAPDFEADLLDGNQNRTGETVRLSDLRGKPVGLVFGSWT